MGWQDAPVVGGDSWQSAPVVGKTEAPKSASLWDKIKGAGEAGLAVATAIPAAVAGNVAGVAQTLTGGKYGTPEGIREGEQRAQEVARNLTYQPRGEAGQGYVQDIAGVVDKSKLAGLGPTEAMALAGAAGPAVRQIEAAIANSPEIDALKAVSQLPGKAAKAVLPMPKPEVAALARKAAALDIPLRPDMLTDNRFARMMGEAFEKIPLAGSRSDARQIAFNRAVMAQIGGDRNAVRLTPEVFKEAMESSGSTIGNIAKKTPIKVDAEATALLAEQVRRAGFEPNDIGRVVVNYVKELTDKAGADGVIPGETFRKINTQIGAQVRTTSNGDLRAALTRLQADMHEMLTQNIANPADLEALQVARQQYAIGSTLIPLVAKSKSGDISPQSLMQAMTSTTVKKGYMAKGGAGEMGDLARIGQLFLKEPPSSGTAERSLVYGGALGGAGLVEPTTAAGIYGAANIYNRAGPAMVNRMLSLDPLRK